MARLEDLSTELLYNIGKFVESDKDLLSLAQSSKYFHAMFNSKASGIWAHRYEQFYDTAPDWRQRYAKALPGHGKALGVSSCNELACYLYIRARRRGPDDGPPCCERHHLHYNPTMLVMLLNEAYKYSENPNSKNMASLTVFADRTRILQLPFLKEKDDCPRQVKAIYTALFHQVLDLRSSRMPYAVQESQRIAFGHSSLFPIFENGRPGTVDLHNVVHILNLFKNNLLAPRENESLIEQDFTALPYTLRPKAWTAPLTRRPRPLGRHWKGIRLSPLDMVAVRNGGSYIDGCGYLPLLPSNLDLTIHNLKLSFNPAHQPCDAWPEDLMRVVKSYKIKLSSPLQYNDNRFVGTFDKEHNRLLAGIVSNLPPQQDLNGFQRVSFIEYTDPDAVNGPDRQTSNHALGGVMDLDDEVVFRKAADATEAATYARGSKRCFDEFAEDEPVATQPARFAFNGYNWPFDRIAADDKWLAYRFHDDDPDLDFEPRDEESESDEPCSHKMWSHAWRKGRLLVPSNTSRSMLQPANEEDDKDLQQARNDRRQNRENEDRHREEDLQTARRLSYRQPHFGTDINLSEPQELQHFEGVVLPGGQIMVGRFRPLDEGDLDGNGVGDLGTAEDLKYEQLDNSVFLYWCVDDHHMEFILKDTA